MPDGVAARFSCRTGQLAYETDRLGKGHGIFFHYVIEGLRKEAKNRRGEVTWNGLVEYVTAKVNKKVPELVGSDAEQTPHQISNIAGLPVLLPARKEVVRNIDDAPVEEEEPKVPAPPKVSGRHGRRGVQVRHANRKVSQPFGAGQPTFDERPLTAASLALPRGPSRNTSGDT